MLSVSILKGYLCVHMFTTQPFRFASLQMSPIPFLFWWGIGLILQVRGTESRAYKRGREKCTVWLEEGICCIPCRIRQDVIMLWLMLLAYRYYRMWGKCAKAHLREEYLQLNIPLKIPLPPPFILDFLNRSEYVNSLQDGNKAEIFF